MDKSSNKNKIKIMNYIMKWSYVNQLLKRIELNVDVLDNSHVKINLKIKINELEILIILIKMNL